MKKYFVTSDVHSFYDELMESLNKAQFDINNENHILCVCGDLFDRGPKSVEVFEFAKSLGDRFFYVRGNHEDLLYDCVKDIANNKIISSHHFSNGTVKTIEQFCGLKSKELWFPRRSHSLNLLVYEKMKPILDWIDIRSVNYIIIGDCILVHGWAPIIGDSLTFLGEWVNPKVVPIEEWGYVTESWGQARWSNGMKMWKEGARLNDYTIICGHWHCSYGWSHIDQERKEFPDKNKKDWQKSFEPWCKEGIVAIDSCCAYSGFLNCIVLEVDDE